MEFSNRVVILNFVLFVTLSFISYASSQKQVDQDILKKILGDPYDKRFRPVGRGENASDPVSVSINLYVRNIETIDELKMEYSVHLTFRQEWNDLRLSFSKYNPPADLAYLTITNVDQVWKPDVFVSNERKAHLHEFMQANTYIRIFPNGDILYSSRISMTLSCPMDLTQYPFDEQTCSIRLASYGYTNKDVQFLWKDEVPVQIKSDMRLPKFSFVDHNTTTCDSSTTTGTYSCLLANFKFQREFTYFLLHVYIPCNMLVIVSWLSFWLDSRAVTARALLGLSALLVMATEVSSFNRTLPPVSYTKALDEWTGICVTFVFASLLEFIIVNYLVRSEIHFENTNNSAKNQQETGKDEEIPLNQVNTGSEGGDIIDGVHPTSSTTRGNGRMKKLAKKYWTQFGTLSEKIDGASRILFPLAFVLFNVIYWSVYN